MKRRYDEGKWFQKKIFGVTRRATCDFDCWEAAAPIGQLSEMEELYEVIDRGKSLGDFTATQEFGKTYVMHDRQGDLLVLSDKAKEAYLRRLKNMIELYRKNPLAPQDQPGFDDLTLTQKVEAIIAHNSRCDDD